MSGQYSPTHLKPNYGGIYDIDEETGKYIVPIPTPAQTYTYTGELIIPQFTDFNSLAMYMDGKQARIEPGTYPMTFVLWDGERCIWEDLDDTHDERVVNWTIQAASGSLVLNDNTVTFNDKYGKATVGYTAHTSKLQFSCNAPSVDGVPTISASCSNEAIFIKATNAVNGTYLLTITAPATSNHSAITRTITIIVAIEEFGSDLYLEADTVAYGDQWFETKWSKIYQTIDRIGLEVGYQSQSLTTSINSLARVEIEADENHAHIGMMATFNGTTGRIDITAAMVDGIERSSIVLDADQITLEGYTTINGGFKVSDGSDGYSSGTVFLKDAYIGEPNNTFMHIYRDTGTNKYGLFGTLISLYETQYQDDWSRTITTASLDFLTPNYQIWDYTRPGWAWADMTTSLNAKGLNVDIYNHQTGTLINSGSIEIKHAGLGNTSQPTSDFYFNFTAPLNMESAIATKSGETYILGSKTYLTPRNVRYNGVNFTIVDNPLPSWSESGGYFTHGELKMTTTYGTTAATQADDDSDEFIGLWFPGRLIVGKTARGIYNDEGVMYAVKASIDGALYVQKSIYCHGTVHSNYTATSSDRRLKKDIEPLDNRYLKLFDNLDVIRYKYIYEDDDESQDEKDRYNIGLIAQDTIFAADKSGLTPKEQGFIFGSEMRMYSLDYNQLAMLTAYKLKAIEKDYERRISILEAKVESLLKED